MTNFDGIAQHYHWMERLSFGRSLQRCRTRFIPELSHFEAVLIVGEGDGRFLEALLKHNSMVKADVVDSSAAMLALAQRRAQDAGRVKTFHVNALEFEPSQKYDAIVTNFFLDCLTQEQLNALVKRYVHFLNPGGLWIVSEFSIPHGVVRPFAKLLVRLLYTAFGVLTKLRITKLPNFEQPMLDAGFFRPLRHASLCGILTAELWRLSTS